MKRSSMRWGMVLLILVLLGGGGWVLFQAFPSVFVPSSEREAAERPTITLIQKPWGSSTANNAVARIVLEEEMGYPVEIIEIEQDQDMARVLITGEGSANLEIWPTELTSDFNRYLEARIITNIGPLGVMGQAGWYVPSYLLDAHPELREWEALQMPEVVELFTTQDSGNRGVIVSGNQTWNAHIEMLLNNLDLPYDVEYTGSEAALLRAIDLAYQNEEPILFYLWEPHPVHTQYDLTRIELPRHSEECYALLNSSGVYCDYPSDILLKLVHPELEQTAPAVVAFVRNFYYPSNDAQLSLMQAIDESETTDAGARRWLRENEDIWRDWIPDRVESLPPAGTPQSSDER